MKLIADSGATKTAWALVQGNQVTHLKTQGLSPYYFTPAQIADTLKTELLPNMPADEIEAVYFYGTGCATKPMQDIVTNGLKLVWGKKVKTEVASDLTAAARSLCGKSKGVVCILGTGSNSCVYNGKKITRNNPAPGYVLGDEGSGAYLGKKVLQHFIYQTFDEELMHKFNLAYNTNYRTILDHVYKQPWPNRYLASFTTFLSENRGHFMIENILEDGIGDFIMTHLYKYSESWIWPINFTGSIAWHFRDKLEELATSFQLQLGVVRQAPLDGLVAYHAG